MCSIRWNRPLVADPSENWRLPARQTSRLRKPHVHRHTGIHKEPLFSTRKSSLLCQLFAHVADGDLAFFEEVVARCAGQLLLDGLENACRLLRMHRWSESDCKG